jgi:hypothetical protein
VVRVRLITVGIFVEILVIEVTSAEAVVEGVEDEAAGVMIVEIEVAKLSANTEAQEMIGVHHPSGMIGVGTEIAGIGMITSEAVDHRHLRAEDDHQIMEPANLAMRRPVWM